MSRDYPLPPPAYAESSGPDATDDFMVVGEPAEQTSVQAEFVQKTTQLGPLDFNVEAESDRTGMGVIVHVGRPGGTPISFECFPQIPTASLYGQELEGELLIQVLKIAQKVPFNGVLEFPKTIAQDLAIYFPAQDEAPEAFICPESSADASLAEYDMPNEVLADVVTGEPLGPIVVSEAVIPAEAVASGEGIFKSTAAKYMLVSVEIDSLDLDAARPQETLVIRFQHEASQQFLQFRVQAKDDLQVDDVEVLVGDDCSPVGTLDTFIDSKTAKSTLIDVLSKIERDTVLYQKYDLGSDVAMLSYAASEDDAESQETATKKCAVM